MSTLGKSYFGKAIIFLVLSAAIFFVLKTFLPDRLFPDDSVAGRNVMMDSMAIAAQNDTILEIEVDSTQFKEYRANNENFNPSLSADGYMNLERFYTKLSQLEKDSTVKVRIGYFGDSMNDGDYIVQDVRSAYQGKYGGQGVGFVSISNVSAGARASVSHQFSTNWYSQSFLNVKRPVSPFGIDGQIFFARYAGQTYWVKYRAQSQPHATMLNKPTLFYGNSRNSAGTVTIKADNNELETKTLQPTSLLNTMRLVDNAQTLQVNFRNADSIPIYGFNFDNGSGVHVDNFSTRGNSGLPLSILNTSLMNAFDRELNYDLIVLHYGANVLGYGSTNYNWYAKNMTAVVRNLQACFPNADILIISTADKSSKIGGVMQTSPAVVPLAKAQQTYAQRTNCGFINLYELMGGNGSMIKWVNNRLAGKDYTHFNVAGSKKIAHLIYQELEKGYSKYKTTK